MTTKPRFVPTCVRVSECCVCVCVCVCVLLVLLCPRCLNVAHMFQEIASKDPSRARVYTHAHVTRLLTDSNGTVNGVEYKKDGKVFQEQGPVIIATVRGNWFAVHRLMLL